MAPDWLLALPAVNAALNSIATVLLVWGYVTIRRQKTRWRRHRNLMLAAFAVSVLFLVSYLVYHFGLAWYTGSSGRKLQSEGAIRVVYLGILLTHIVLAASVPFLAIWTIVRAWKGKFEKHRRIARITFPIWLYVSITGVLIYGMLYHWPT